MNHYNPLLDSNDETFLRESGGLPTNITITIKKQPAPKRRKSKETNSVTSKEASYLMNTLKKRKKKKVRESELATSTEILEAWSDAARAAAAAARKARSSGMNKSMVRLAGRKAFRDAGGVRTPSRMKRLVRQNRAKILRAKPLVKKSTPGYGRDQYGRRISPSDIDY